MLWRSRDVLIYVFRIGVFFSSGEALLEGVLYEEVDGV